MSKYDTTQTTDTIIFNALIKAQEEGHPLLQEFNIQYPSENILGEEPNNIFVATIDEEYYKKTMNSEHYNALVKVIVKTKQTDYITASQITKTTVKVIKQILRNNEELKSRGIIFRNNTSDYRSKFALKGRHLLVQAKEVEFLDVDEDEVKNICEIIAKINEEVKENG